MDQTKRARTLAQVKLQQNLKNAAETLKARGLKAHTKDKHALVKHRRQGRPNSEFFEALGVNITAAPRVTARKPRTTRRPTVVTATEFVEMIPKTTNAATSRRNIQKVNTYRKKAETIRQRAKKLQEECEKKLDTLVKQADAAEQEADTAAAKVTQAMPKPILKTARRARPFSSLKQINTPIYSTKSRTARNVQLETPQTMVKPRNELFVKAGKKGLTTEKGKAWHANIARARANIQNFLQSQGINKKATGTAAVKLASIMRKDPSSAAAFKNKLLASMRRGQTARNTRPQTTTTARAQPARTARAQPVRTPTTMTTRSQTARANRSPINSTRAIRGRHIKFNNEGRTVFNSQLNRFKSKTN